MHVKSPDRQGFTLIELSIVLVIIGLIVGGVLVGQDLIRAGEVRATITQVEKYNTAANTFRGRFGYLPGDIPNPTAGQFGFATRGVYYGEGDGNGILDGVTWNGSTGGGGNYGSAAGETAMFWVDLSSAAAGTLIDGGFNTATPNVVPGADITGTNINLYLPQAKIGRGNYFYVHSTTYWNGSTSVDLGINYFGLSAVNNIAASSRFGYVLSTANIPVSQAYAIDSKIDDGMPQSGNVMAWYLGVNGDLKWTDGTDATSSANQPKPTTTAIAGSSTTCYDNSSTTSGTPGIANATQHYSLEISNGAGANCALSFKFQ